MVSIPSLWLPIVLSAVGVFVVSSIIHMFMTYHRNDFGPVPDEDKVMAALRPFNLPPGDYIMPHAGSPDAMKSPEFADKLKQGPVAFIHVLPSAAFNMGPALLQWFVYCLLISVTVAYVLGRTLDPGASYLAAFRLAGTVAFCAYAFALWQNTIWYKKSWKTTLKSTFDGLVYAAVTAGFFGWRWPA